MWGQIAGAALGGISGAKSEGGQARAPKWAKKQAKRGSNMLVDAAARPADQAIAGFNADQTAAFQGVRDAQGFGDAELAQAQDNAAALANGVTPEDIAQFYDPYQQDVINAAMADIENVRAKRSLGAKSEAEAAGAFGGDREAVYRASLDGEYDRTSASTVAGLRSTGYSNAANLAVGNQGFKIAGNAQLANMINQRRENRYTDAATLYGSGATQQAHEQSLLDYPITAGQMLQSGASQFYTGGSPSTGGGIDGAMQGILGGADFGKKIGDIIRGMGSSGGSRWV